MFKGEIIMNKLDRMIKEAKKLISGKPFLIAEIIPCDDCYQIQGCFTRDGRHFTEIRDVVTEYQEGLARIDEIKKREGIKEKDFVLVRFDYGDGGG